MKFRVPNEIDSVKAPGGARGRLARRPFSVAVSSLGYHPLPGV